MGTNRVSSSQGADVIGPRPGEQFHDEHPGGVVPYKTSRRYPKLRPDRASKVFTDGFHSGGCIPYSNSDAILDARRDAWRAGSCEISDLDIILAPIRGMWWLGRLTGRLFNYAGSGLVSLMSSLTGRSGPSEFEADCDAAVVAPTEVDAADVAIAHVAQVDDPQVDVVDDDFPTRVDHGEVAVGGIQNMFGIRMGLAEESILPSTLSVLPVRIL